MLMVKVHSERESAGSNKCKREKRKRKLREKSCHTRERVQFYESASSGCVSREKEEERAGKVSEKSKWMGE